MFFSFLNRIIDKILNHCKGKHKVILLEPKASFILQPLIEREATAVMGVKVYDTKKMLQIVSQAGGTGELLKMR